MRRVPVMLGFCLTQLVTSVNATWSMSLPASDKVMRCTDGVCTSPADESSGDDTKIREFSTESPKKNTHHSTASADKLIVGGIDAEALANAIIEKLESKRKEREKAKKETAVVVISNATGDKVNPLIRRVGLVCVEGDLPIVDEGGTRFDAFSWCGRSKEDGLPDARTHIENQMRKFGVPLGRDGYKIVDVHRDQELLDVDDEKIGVIRGGSDIAIVPFNIATFGIRKQICVLWEIKTEQDTSQYPDEGLYHFIWQGFVELLAARCLSNQPGVLVVLTDLVSGALLLKIDYNEEYQVFGTVEYEATLDQMGLLVAQFLSESTVPDASFRPHEDHQDPRDVPALIFKKTKLGHN